jgi:hypothetical protein
VLSIRVVGFHSSNHSYGEMVEDFIPIARLV